MTHMTPYITTNGRNTLNILKIIFSCPFPAIIVLRLFALREPRIKNRRHFEKEKKKSGGGVSLQYICNLKIPRPYSRSYQISSFKLDK